MWKCLLSYVVSFLSFEVKFGLLSVKLLIEVKIQNPGLFGKQIMVLSMLSPVFSHVLLKLAGKKIMLFSIFIFGYHTQIICSFRGFFYRFFLFSAHRTKIVGKRQILLYFFVDVNVCV